MLITLVNDFHNTETVIRVAHGRVSNRAGRNWILYAAGGAAGLAVLL